MKHFRDWRSHLLLAFLVAHLTGCAFRPRTVDQYDNDGVHFAHFSTWSIVKDAPLENKPSIRSISVHGPDNAVLLLLCEPASSTQTLEEYASVVAELRAAHMPDKLKIGPLKALQVGRQKSSETTRSIAGEPRKGIIQRFDVEVLGLPLPHEAEFYMVTNSRYRVMVMTHVAERHSENTRRDSQVILDSLSFRP